MLFTRPSLATLTILLSVSNAAFVPFGGYNADDPRRYGDTGLPGAPGRQGKINASHQRSPWVVHTAPDGTSHMYTLVAGQVIVPERSPIRHLHATPTETSRYRGAGPAVQVEYSNSRAVAHCQAVMSNMPRGQWNVAPITTFVAHPDQRYHQPPYWHNAVRFDSEPVMAGDWRRICFQAPVFRNQGPVNGSSETYGQVVFKFSNQVGALFEAYHPGAIDHYFRLAMEQSVRNDHSMEIHVRRTPIAAPTAVVAAPLPVYHNMNPNEPEDPTNYVFSTAFKQNAGRDLVTDADHQEFLHDLKVWGRESAPFWQNHSVCRVADNGARLISIWRVSKKLNQLKAIAQVVNSLQQGRMPRQRSERILARVVHFIDLFREELTMLTSEHNTREWDINNVLDTGVSEDRLATALHLEGLYDAIYTPSSPLFGYITDDMRQKLRMMA